MSFRYLTAGKLVDGTESGKSLKSLCAAMPKLGKTEYALVMQTLKYLPVLRQMTAQIGISAQSLDVKAGLLFVMLYELVFGTGKISGGGVVKRKVMEHKDALLALRDELMQGKAKFEELLSESVQEALRLPLYVRINEAKMSVASGLQYLQENFEPETFIDPLVPSLVVLSPSCKGIAQDVHVKDGSFVIQDKASCFPAQILFNEHRRLIEQSNNTSDLHNCDFVDACAAPGNKTSHLAALLAPQQEGKSSGKKRKSPSTEAHRVFAFDKSTHRVKIIERRMNLLGVNDVVSVANKDFLTVDVNEGRYANVQYLLLDPSCSGSGIVRNIERMMDQDAPKGGEEEEEENQEDSDHQRLLKLQAFQISIIQKAMTFPEAHTISYSTCSIHEEENEHVVVKILQSEIGADWELHAPTGFESWSHRGIASDDLSQSDADKLIRCSPSDGTNGFFVALFKKKPDAPKRILKHVAVAQELKQDTEENREDLADEGKTSTEKTSITKKAKTKQPSTHQPKSDSLFGKKFSVSNKTKRRFGRK